MRPSNNSPTVPTYVRVLICRSPAGLPQTYRLVRVPALPVALRTAWRRVLR
jgi:hypothetical protein